VIKTMFITPLFLMEITNLTYKLNIFYLIFYIVNNYIIIKIYNKKRSSIGTGGVVNLWQIAKIYKCPISNGNDSEG